MFFYNKKNKERIPIKYIKKDYDNIFGNGEFIGYKIKFADNYVSKTGISMMYVNKNSENYNYVDKLYRIFKSK